MRPEDLNKAFEDAFAKIEPKDDAQREKLAKFREKLRESNERLAKELDAVKAQTERMSSPRAEYLREVANDRSRIAKETTSGITSSFVEHAAMIDRICEATRRKKG